MTDDCDAEENCNPVPLFPKDELYDIGASPSRGSQLILHGNSHLTQPNNIVFHTNTTQKPTCIMHPDGKVSWGDNTKHSINMETLKDKLKNLFGQSTAETICGAILEELEKDIKAIICPVTNNQDQT